MKWDVGPHRLEKGNKAFHINLSLVDVFENCETNDNPKRAKVIQIPPATARLSLDIYIYFMSNLCSKMWKLDKQNLVVLSLIITRILWEGDASDKVDNL